MVDFIDIHKLTLEELSGVVDIYPWYGGARMELCRRMAELGALSESQVARTALHVSSRRMLYELVKGRRKTDCSDKDARSLAEAYIGSPAAKPGRVHAAGGDYFSQEQYDRITQSGDEVFPRFPAWSSTGRGQDREPADGFPELYTETLAQIYAEQGYPEQAKKIYSKLILAYPEKNAYFAALIQKLEQEN